jgi:hypothetical protein
MDDPLIIKSDELDQMVETVDVLAFPDGIYQWVLIMCFTHPINITSGFYYEMYLCGTMGIVLFFSSLNYWRNPLKNSLARKIDMFCSFTIVSYHYYLCIFSFNKLLCISIISSGISMYPLSLYLHHKHKLVKQSALCHCLLHALIIIGVCFTYKDYYDQDKSLKWHL